MAHKNVNLRQEKSADGESEACREAMWSKAGGSDEGLTSQVAPL